MASCLIFIYGATRLGGSRQIHYSDLKLLTGFCNPALIAWKLTVAKAISIAIDPDRINTHQ